MTTKPDLSPERQYAEAVAYGKSLAVREILDALTADRPAPLEWTPRPPMSNFRGLSDRYWRDDYVRGYDRAKRIVQDYRCGVEKP